MKCEFCAEQIQDEAVVCRFCGAVKLGDGWQMAAAPGRARAPAGTFTFRFAAAAFGLSAVLELPFLGSAVPLFGALRGGVVAVLYRAVYAGLFAGLSIGLWRGKRWGYPLLLAATCFYTVDKLRYVLDPTVLKAEIEQQLATYGGAFRDMFDGESVIRLTRITVLLFVACWWGFVLYARRRRSYFSA